MPRVSVPDPLPLYRERPSPVQNISVIEQILSDGERDLKDYSAEIDRLQSKSLPLQQERAYLVRYLDHLRSSIAPIWGLPNELLAEIFEYVCLDDLTSINKRIQEEDKTLVIPQLLLGAVCFLWRNVLHTVPSCWTDLSVWLSPGGMPHPDLLQLFLGLSKQRLLNLEIMFIDVQNLQEIVDHPSYKALTSQAHRWQTLNLTGDNWQELNILRGPTAQSFPELTELHMRWFDAGPEEPVLNFSPLPKLRDFGILLYDPVGPDPSIPWHQLTSLQLQGTVNVPSCLAICKKLARLDLFIRNVQPTYPIDSSVSVVHTALERCTLYLTPLDPEINEAETDAIEKILNLLSFPAIDTLDVRRDDIYDGHVAWPSEAMNSFIHRCTALTDLWLDDISISDHEFIAFLLEIPLIEFLCIRELRPTDDDSANLSFPLSSYFIRRLCIDESNSSREHFLPRLKEFSFAINKEFNEAEYVEMVRSRYYYVHEEDGLAISSLEMVYLNLGYEGAPILQAVDAYKLKPLADLQDEGFRFTVSIAGQEIDFDALEGSEFDDSENDKTTGGETDAL